MRGALLIGECQRAGRRRCDLSLRVRPSTENCCSSSTSLGTRSLLHGRRTADLRLEPFGFRKAADFHPKQAASVLEAIALGRRSQSDVARAVGLTASALAPHLKSSRVYTGFHARSRLAVTLPVNRYDQRYRWLFQIPTSSNTAFERIAPRRGRARVRGR